MILKSFKNKLDRKKTIELLEKIKCENRLANILNARKLTFIGHRLSEENTLVKVISNGFSLRKETERRSKNQTE